MLRPNVSAELQALHTLLGSETLVDKEFVAANLEKKLKDEQFTIVHVASHGEFGNEVDKTFLLTFDDKLSLDRLNQMVGVFRFRDDPLELLTLSACDTAAGDDRAALGLAGGVLTVAGIAVGAIQTPANVASWFAPLEYATAAVGVVTLTAAGLTLVRAARLQPVAPGPATGDLASDLGELVPPPLRGNPWRLAVTIAILVAFCIAFAGIVQSDPIDGVVRALADALACLAGFALLGRWLGLRA